MVKQKPKSNDGRREKHYTVDEAVRMFPYIQSYCRDIENAYYRTKTLVYRYYKLNSLTTTSPFKEKKRVDLMCLMEYKIECLWARYEDWVKELNNLHCFVCDPIYGYIDVPVYSKSLNHVIYLCVTRESMPELISWHRLDEGCGDCRPFEWAIKSEMVV